MTLGLNVPDELLDAVADRVAARLASRLEPLVADRAQPAGWMDSKAAAEYLGLSVNALRKLTSERSVPFSQDAPGGKCWFHASDLDEWRRANAR